VIKKRRIKKIQESKKQKITPFQQLDYFKMTTNQNYPENKQKKYCPDMSKPV